MKISKVLISLIAAEIFCLFINITLGGTSNPLMRTVCAVCTVGILCVLLANTAIRGTQDAMKQERITGQPPRRGASAAAGLLSSVPALASWTVLLISKNSGKFDFYKWHKLINAPFLQVYNLIEPDASVRALSAGEICLMLPLTFIPAAVCLTVSLLTRKGLITAEK
ncbi:MAG: hypothetical protein IJM44_04950 [Ruminococcus sp.]|nr:hypothetical protein [Ruminococcus sp.]